jgi:SH3-like domain-containing protein
VVTNAGEFGLRIRETPGGNQIDFLPDGTVLEVIPEPQVKTDDGITWQKVRDPKGRVGWVSTEYIVVQ